MIIEGLACTLTRAELADRIVEWRAVTGRATSRTMEGNTLVATYPPDPALVSELRRLIDAEKGCCSFMEARVEGSPAEVVVHLEVPRQMEHLLNLIAGPTTEGNERRGLPLRGLEELHEVP
jgi:hypothetical protein